ncbi:ABC transporter substrate-binding protein [Pigmentiphaga sp. GD03639]|uniref:ABC transporter substrate-binding protein n=1 Tax=unclassified Pigmentiphaga TaxID=2626614 RepID=UPI00244D6A4F|nr:ABC transporter substrate-binding protein [Pigmentiphaga sp. GD03639]MDH2235164.1 ABC transporter substrate-binding protein [Pigmentiphaga sp. GD03639]
MNRRQFLATLSASALAGAHVRPVLAQPRALTPIKFTLDFRVTSQTSPFFLALAKGYYKEAGLDVSIDVGSGSVASITRVASGAYDLGLGDISSLVEFHAQSVGAPVQAVYQYYNRAPFVIIGRKDRGITTDFASLRGKRVAAAAVEATRRCWPMAARQLGVSPDLFQWITTDFSTRDNVMVRGDVDAATYFHDSAVSLFARMPPQELAVLEYARTGLALYGNAVLASRRLIAEKPAAVKAFLAATNRALVETLADPEPALAAIKAREAIIDLKVERARWHITRRYLATDDTRADGLGSVRADILQRQIDEVAAVFDLPARPPIGQIFDDSLLPPAAQRKVPA